MQKADGYQLYGLTEEERAIVQGTRCAIVEGTSSAIVEGTSSAIVEGTSGAIVEGKNAKDAALEEIN